MKSILRDEDGAVLVETTVSILVLISLVFGVVEFSYAFYQWNSAAKAVQLGARAAAVTNPVATELLTITGLGGAKAGSPYASSDEFSVTCSGKQKTCQCDNNKCSSKTFSYNGTAMGRILAPMMTAFPRIAETNVTVKYEYTGLGYAGRPGGPVPTITVSLSDIPFNFVLLSAFLPGGRVNMPAFATTVTGEDLNYAGSS